MDLLTLERHRSRLVDEALDRRRRHIETHVPAMVAALAARAEVQRVILFGSVARGDIRVDSDIDLAVEGLSGADSIHAWLDVETAAAGIPFDLVELERAPIALRQQIGQDGVTLFERQSSPCRPATQT